MPTTIVGCRWPFRCIHGDTALTRELRRHVHDVLADQKPFFLNLAVNTIERKAADHAYVLIVQCRGYARVLRHPARSGQVQFAAQVAQRQLLDRTATEGYRLGPG